MKPPSFQGFCLANFSREQREGGSDDKNAKKHRNDVARLLQLLSPDSVYELPASVHADMADFTQAVANAEDFEPKQFGVAMTREAVVERLRSAYRL